MLRTFFLSMSLLGSFSLFAESPHHEREKVKIEIEEHHHHHKQKGLVGMLVGGGVQLAENNAYLISAAGAGLFLYAPLKFKRRFNDTQIIAMAAGIWIGGGMITRSIMKAVMSQADIKRI